MLLIDRFDLMLFYHLQTTCCYCLVFEFNVFEFNVNGEELNQNVKM